jgi:hypothetical protein
MMSNKVFLKQYYVINSSFNILKNILLSVAMLMKENKADTTIIPEDKLAADWDNIESFKN